MAVVAISQSGSLIPGITKAKISAASIFRILDWESKIDCSDESGTVIEEVKGEIELRQVSFHYPTRPDVQILQHLSLVIPSGKVTL